MCANFSSLLLKSAILILQKKEQETSNSLAFKLLLLTHSIPTVFFSLKTLMEILLMLRN